MWVSSEAKAGKDAAELAGLDGSTGIAATNVLEARGCDVRRDGLLDLPLIAGNGLYAGNKSG